MLVAKNQEINLGNLKYGVPHKFSFILTNEGSTDILINSVQVGCSSCTTASLTSSKIKPKEETKVNVVFTPGSTGINNKSISVLYNKSVLKLKFKAVVN